MINEELKCKSWKSEPKFDSILSQLSPSGLKHLKDSYIKEMREFSLINDLTEEDNRKGLYVLKRKYSMINEELQRRIIDTQVSMDNYTFFTGDHNSIYMTDNQGHKEIYDVYYTPNYARLDTVRRIDMEEEE